jgi:hypothetical protein
MTSRSAIGKVVSAMFVPRDLNCPNPEARRRKMSIWTILFVILLIAWIGGFTVFHVASGLIHLLLIFAVISLILHFVMGRSAV